MVTAMAEYIERGAATFEVYKLSMDAFRRNDRKDCICYNKVYSLLIYAPAADVAPVVHGRWINRGWEKGFECSNCHSLALLNYESEYHKSDYCPHCGARMDGEVK